MAPCISFLNINLLFFTRTRENMQDTFSLLKELPSTKWDGVLAHEYEQWVEPFTFSFVPQMLEPFVQNKLAFEKNGCSSDDRKLKILDVGCGTGAASLFARSIGFEVTATDVSADMVVYTRHRCHAENSDPIIKCVVADGQSLPKQWHNQFDCAMSVFSLIFFPDPLKGLKEIHSCLKSKTGNVVVSAWGSPEETAAFQVFPDAIKALFGEDAAIMDKVKPKRMHGSPAALVSLLERAGLVNVEIVGPVVRMLRVGSPESYYNRFALASPNIKGFISSLDASMGLALKNKVMELAIERGGARVRRGTSDNSNDESIEIPSTAYFAYGTKP